MKRYDKTFKIALTLVAAAGLFFNTGILQGTIRYYMLAYYTILSNLVVFLYYLSRCVATRRTHSAGVKGGVVLMITITMLVYNILLAPGDYAADPVGFWGPANLLPHIVVPLMVILDWLLFDPKGTLRPRDPVIWLSLPLAYFFFALVRARGGSTLGSSGSRYPYYFMDVDVLGRAGVARWALGLAAAFLALGFVLYWIDRHLGRRAEKSPG